MDHRLPVLMGRRLHLREPTRADGESLFACLGDAEVTRFLAFEPPLDPARHARFPGLGRSLEAAGPRTSSSSRAAPPTNRSAATGLRHIDLRLGTAQIWDVAPPERMGHRPERGGQVASARLRIRPARPAPGRGADRSGARPFTACLREARRRRGGTLRRVLQEGRRGLGPGLVRDPRARVAGAERECCRARRTDGRDHPWVTWSSSTAR